MRSDAEATMLRTTARLFCCVALAGACLGAAAQDADVPSQEWLMPADLSATAPRPGLAALLRGLRQSVAQRLHFRAAPEPAAALLQMTQLRLKLEGDTELAVRMIGGVQLTLRSSF